MATDASIVSISERTLCHQARSYDHKYCYFVFLFTSSEVKELSSMSWIQRNVWRVNSCAIFVNLWLCVHWWTMSHKDLSSCLVERIVFTGCNCEINLEVAFANIWKYLGKHSKQWSTASDVLQLPSKKKCEELSWGRDEF